MKLDKGDWTNAVRRSLEGAEESQPQGGWERLERELGKTTPVPAGIPLRRVWLKFAAAAAVVLVCVSIGVRVARNDKNVLKRVVLLSEAAVSGQNTDMEESNTSVSDHIAALREQVGFPVSGDADFSDSANRVNGKELVAVSSRPVVQKSAVREAAFAEDAIHSAVSTSVEEPVSFETQGGLLETSAMEASDSDSAYGVQGGEIPALGVETPKAETDVSTDLGQQNTDAALKNDVQQQTHIYNTADYDGLFASVEPQRSHGGAFGVYAGGAISPAGGGEGVDSGMLLAESEGSASLRYAYREYSYKHKQPLGFGLTFRKQLGHGLSAETGLIYTLLRSEVTVPGGVQDVHQVLHFVGIPLRFNWEFLRSGNFSLYVGAGGAAEKCVSARFAGAKVSEKGVQWSVFGAVGAQYRFGKTVGIYFEPEISHYFTETTLRTPYTDSSVNLNLQIGLRFNY